MNDRRITLYLDTATKQALEDWAKVEHRSVNNLILRELSRLLEQRYKAASITADYLLNGVVPK